MRTLSEITAAVRLGEWPEHHELRMAIVAYDVLLRNLEVPENAVQLKEYGIAADLPPDAYVGKENNPDNPEAVEWYRIFSTIKIEAVPDDDEEMLA